MKILEDDNALKKLWEVSEALITNSQSKKKDLVYTPLLKMLLKVIKSAKASSSVHLLNLYKDSVFKERDEKKKAIIEEILTKLLSIAIITPKTTITVINLIQKFIIMYFYLTI